MRHVEVTVRPVRSGDIEGMTRVILAARGFAGAALDRQVQGDLARFRQQGLVERIERDALVAVLDGELIGVMRYGEFNGEAHLSRPEVDPLASQEAVTRAFLRALWPSLDPETERAVFIDYPHAGGLLGDLFVRNGFAKLVDRLDMRLNLQKVEGASAKPLYFASYSAGNHDRFFQAFKDSFQGSLDPMMAWDAAHPEESFTLFRDGFGRFEPDLWVLATDEEGRDVGFAMFQPFAGGRYGGDVVLLYTGVIPEARGEGYGAEIVREGLRRILKSRGVGAAVSLTVSKPNRPAQAIYERLGFLPTEAFSVYRGFRA
ncbi:MAG TPA: GNAT family N-acetyltransferase [Bacilli bacterium]|nr:GNAT family N-acetyltransferase [Bacilli bacterium]